MASSESWETSCCRCGADIQVNLYPGKRACHVTCGPCLYPDNWSKCSSCETVTHCMYALSHLKDLKSNDIVKGCFFKNQLNGEETLSAAYMGYENRMIDREIVTVPQGYGIRVAQGSVASVGNIGFNVLFQVTPK